MSNLCTKACMDPAYAPNTPSDSAALGAEGGRWPMSAQRVVTAPGFVQRGAGRGVGLWQEGLALWQGDMRALHVASGGVRCCPAR